MKSLVYFYAAVVSVASVTYAKNCNKGTYYCGSTLIDMGDYDDQVKEALADHGIASPTNFQTQNSLFYCVGPPNGQIAYIETCAIACRNEGTGNDDDCLTGTGFRVPSSHNRLKAKPNTKDEDRRLVINW